MRITEEQFMMRQPSFPERSATDPYYHRLANHLAEAGEKRKLLPGWPEAVVNRVCLGLVGYIQDILCDAGIWRSFINRHNEMYGKWLPYYETSEDYIPHELNPEDVRFLTWYTLSMNYEDRRLCNPMDPEIARAAEVWHAMLDRIYEEAPEPQEYHIWKGLEFNNSEEAEQIMHFSHWLYMHCYLLTPAYALTLSEIINRPGMRDPENFNQLRQALHDSMSDDPTGPLALYLKEWLHLILEGRMPKERKAEEPAGENATYRAFVEATGGSPIKFLGSYEEFNQFVTESLGWEKGEEHLPQFKGCRDFVLLVNRQKGMLLAHDICRCIKMEGNPYYDAEYAGSHAIYLMTVRGMCPADLLHYLWEHDALSDAHFPGDSDTMLVRDNRDFIARCYLQQYYRGD